MNPVSFAAMLVLMFQSGPPADTGSPPASRQFDFWIGDWKIDQKILRNDGSWLELPAKTSVSVAIDSNALVEHWEGDVEFFWEGMSAPEHMTGLSIRAFDPRTQKWYIHWMDSRNPYFGTPYAGVFHGNKGEFFREWNTPDGKRGGRITFSEISHGMVHWDLSLSTDEGKTWRTLWVMEMTRVGKTIGD